MFDSDSDKEILNMIKNSPHLEHAKVGERGSLSIDCSVVRNSKQFKDYLIEAEKIVRRQHEST